MYGGQAQHNLSYLDDDGNGTISKDEFIRWHAKVVVISPALSMCGGRVEQ